MDAFLREVTDAVVLGLINFASVGQEDAPDTLHESGFSGTIVSGKGDALLIADGKGEVFEDDAGAKFDTEVFNGEHCCGSLESDGRQ
jgi:hypothetical protein